MAETLGSLCDKLTIVKLKQFHCDQAEKAASLAEQERLLVEEMDVFWREALRGAIPTERLTFRANKVYRQEGHALPGLDAASFGAVVTELAQVNCALWHEQEKVYDFEKVPVAEKDGVVRQLAVLNLRRNQCIDAIDRALRAAVSERRETDDVQ